MQSLRKEVTPLGLMITTVLIVLMNLAVDVQARCNDQSVARHLNKRISASGKIIFSA
jgi:hypothetical protein